MLAGEPTPTSESAIAEAKWRATPFRFLRHESALQQERVADVSRQRYRAIVLAPRFEGDPFRAGVAGEGTNLDTSQLYAGAPVSPRERRWIFWQGCSVTWPVSAPCLAFSRSLSLYSSPHRKRLCKHKASRKAHTRCWQGEARPIGRPLSRHMQGEVQRKAQGKALCIPKNTSPSPTLRALTSGRKL